MFLLPIAIHLWDPYRTGFVMALLIQSLDHHIGCCRCEKICIDGGITTETTL